MILFFCGAPKNGSHYQYFIVTEGMKQRGLPFELVGRETFDGNDRRGGRELLDRMAADPDQVFVCKGHWGTAAERDLLLSYDDIRIFHVWRDVRDVLVSHYHYDMRRFGRSYDDFSHYYRVKGRSHLFYQMEYRKVWDDVGDDPRVHHSSFTELRRNFGAAAADLVSAAGIEGVDVAALERSVSIDRLRTKQNDPSGIMFRRGSVGEHRDVIESAEIYDDIRRIERMGVGGLRVHALLHDPRVLLKPHYPFPGKRILRIGWSAYRKINPKRPASVRRGGRWK